MIGLDTNVVIAWLVEGQALRLKRGETFRIAQIVLLELEWVMRTRLRHDRRFIASMLKRLLALSDFTVDRVKAVELAVEDYAGGGSDFADCLIARDNQAAGCAVTFTMDKDASRKPGFALLRY